MKRIIVTGGSGFIGTNLISSLSKETNTILSIDINECRNFENSNFHTHADILDKKSIENIFKEFKPTHVIHLAARTDLDGHSIKDYEANTKGVLNIVEICNKTTSIERAIYASSRLVCHIGYTPKSDLDFQPNTFYGESKAIGEEIVRKNSPNHTWTILRPTSIWGPWFGVPYNNFFKILQKGLYIHPKGKRIQKSFGYVGNSVHQIQAILDALTNDVTKRVFYLCDYTPIELSTWAEKIQNEFSIKKYKEVPETLLYTAARIGDLAQNLGWKSPPLTSFRYSNMCTEMLHETGELQRICGELPYSLEEGIRETVNWMKAHGE